MGFRGLEKCEFAKTEIRYLGYLISAAGIRPDPKNIAAVTQFKKSKNLTELRSLIGAISYFRKFIRRFAEIIAPLTELTKVGESITDRWSDVHQKALDILIARLVSAPVLAPP